MLNRPKRDGPGCLRRTVFDPRRLDISSDAAPLLQFNADDSDATTDPLFAPSRDLAIRIAEVIADTPARDTVVIDIHRRSTVADCFVICSGDNERQLRAIFRDVVEQLEAAGVRPRRVEGTPPSGWILIDYGDVVVHIFDADQRSFYRLQDVWSDAPTLLAMQ